MYFLFVPVFAIVMVIMPTWYLCDKIANSPQLSLLNAQTWGQWQMCVKWQECDNCHTQCVDCHISFVWCLSLNLIKGNSATVTNQNAGDSPLSFPWLLLSYIHDEVKPRSEQEMLWQIVAPKLEITSLIVPIVSKFVILWILG